MFIQFSGNICHIPREDQYCLVIFLSGGCKGNENDAKNDKTFKKKLNKRCVQMTMMVLTLTLTSRKIFIAKNVCSAQN